MTRINTLLSLRPPDWHMNEGASIKVDRLINTAILLLPSFEILSAIGFVDGEGEEKEARRRSWLEGRERNRTQS